MAHEFIAYIDESGDEGFVFKEPPERASSQWFILSAIIIPASHEIPQLRGIDLTVKPIERQRNAPIHFHKLPHEQRIAVSQAIGDSTFSTVAICINKREVRSAVLRKTPNLYFYATRYLLERLSWFARDNADGHDCRVKVVFSNRTRMSYDDLRDYVRRLRAAPAGQDVRIHWPAIDPDRIVSRAHDQLLALRVADAVASGLGYALELSPYGFCEDRYIRLMEPRTYRHNGRAARSYGIKFFPDTPVEEPHRDGRYSFINRLFPR